jgi:uncharacterized membrane protein YeaQ/YmgE (transglycosylase-associated protein family)
MMLWSLLVFAVIGLLMGAGARLFYPDRQAGHVLVSLLLGLGGALGGGAISWMQWPYEESQFHTGNLILAALGATLFLGVAAGRSYAERLVGLKSQSPSQ